MSDKKFFEATKVMTTKAQDLAAGDLLAWEKIEREIRAAAGSGSTKAVMTPPRPIKIRHTEAAVEAAKRLTKAGFSVQWVEHRPIPAGPAGPAGDQLEIEW